MARAQAGSAKDLSDEDLVARVQSILINAADGRRNVRDDVQYNNLRRELIRRSFNTPPLVSTHPTVDSFAAFIKGVGNKPERVERVREEFKSILSPVEATTAAETDSSTWTGTPSRAAKLQTIRTLLPLAQAGVESMISSLSEPNPNGAPILDERVEALKHLRDLHRKLGELLGAVDAGHFDDELGQGLLAEAARYAKRTARALRDDPMPYLSSALLLGIFEAFGLPGIADYLVGVTQNVRKHGKKPTD